MKRVCRHLFTIATCWNYIGSIQLTHFAQNQYRNVGCYICSAFNCPVQSHNMDNRFSPAEREAWIIVLTVNTGDAWNRTEQLKEQQDCSFCSFNCSQDMSIEACLSLSALQFVSIQNMFLPIYCHYCNQAADYFNLLRVCLLVICSKFWLVTSN